MTCLCRHREEEEEEVEPQPLCNPGSRMRWEFSTKLQLLYALERYDIHFTEGCVGLRARQDRYG